MRNNEKINLTLSRGRETSAARWRERNSHDAEEQERKVKTGAEFRTGRTETEDDVDS